LLFIFQRPQQMMALYVAEVPKRRKDDNGMSTVAIVTAEELAARYKVSVETIRSWARSGILPAMKGGRVLRFDLEEADAALRARAESKGGALAAASA
jgi:excisionase family DNA binding protein